jgi:hypothetical protein
MDDQIKPLSGLFIRPKTKFNREPIFYQLSAEFRHFTIILVETINILFKQFFIASLCSKDIFLFTNVGLVVIPSPISISSKRSVDEKPCPNFSTSSKSSMASNILYIVGRIVPCNAATTQHSFAHSLENYITEPSLGSWLHKHRYKFILGDVKKVIA